MKIDLEVVYNNSDSGETDEQNISLETFDEKIEFLATVCDASGLSPRFLPAMSRAFARFDAHAWA